MRSGIIRASCRAGLCVASLLTAGHVAAAAVAGPQSIDAARRLSWAGRYRESIELYRRSLSAQAPGPEALPAMAELAEVLAWDHQYDRAIAEAEAALKIDPAFAPARIARARALAWSGRHRQALELYDVLLASGPSRRDLTLERAQLLGWSGRLIASERELRSALAQDAGSAKAHAALGELHSWVGDWASSRAEFGRALALSAEDKQAQDGWNRLKDSRRPEASLTPAFFSNSNGFQRSALTTEIGLRPFDNWRLAPSHTHWRYLQFGKSAIEADSADLRLDGQVGLRWRFDGEARGTWFQSGPATFSGRARAGGLAADGVHVMASYQRADLYAGAPSEVIGSFDEASLASVQRRVQLDDFAAAFSAEPGRWRLHADAHYGVYRHAGGNRKFSSVDQVFYRLAGGPEQGVETGYQLYYLDVQHPSPLYFSPDGYLSHGWAARAKGRLGRLRVEVSNLLFYQPQGRQTGDSVEAGLKMDWGRLRAAVDGYYLVSRLDGGPKFVSRHVVAAIQARF
ncbi:MAG TPA: hypothetical protein DCZ01_02880 [Elusimicrobia bacterium]|nr:MAG: hypothetical protein A2X37_05510 [Elusimicrobia bacterium GWA2_66_18]HAZ07475.1 hypothetical protein [Elusimicrobiota bacterium]